MTIRQQLADKITEAWGDGATAQVLTSNGVSIEQIIRSQLLPDAENIVSLTFSDFALQPSELEDESYGATQPIYGYNWTLSIRCRTAGIASDDDLFLLVMAVVDYLRANPSVIDDAGRRYRIQITTGQAIGITDQSYEEFQIPITLT